MNINSQLAEDMHAKNKIYKLIFTLFLSAICLMFVSSASATKYASIGDYGTSDTPEQNVADLVNSWNPEFIVTNGDNTYNSAYNSSQAPYNSWISGTCGASSRFFPSFGNHDSTSGYLAKFGNTCQQYSVKKGDIEFFTFNSDDGSPSTSVRNWLQNALQTSTATWKVVFFHHSAYSSCRHGSNSGMQLPYATWGADVVFSGHDHCYERIEQDGITYIVNGLGGRSPYSFNSAIPGSLVRYNSNNGAMLVETTPTTYRMRFYTHTGVLIDDHTITKAGGGNAFPTANFTSTTNELTANFTDASSDPDGSISSRSWNFGDGSTSTTTNPSHTYAAAGTYSVTLTVTDNEGATGESIQQVSVTIPGSGNVGNTDQAGFDRNSTHTVRRAQSFSMPEEGAINSLSIHHAAGSGNLVMGLYADNANAPGALLGSTADTALSASAGWQTIDLQSSVPLNAGAKFWIAWVLENNPGVAYRATTTGEQGRFASTDLYAAGMPASYGAATEAAFTYSVYASYGPSGGNTAPVFNSNPFTKSSGIQNQSYSDSLANDASDANGDTLSFTKISGPAWLSVASNGDLSGTPATSDVGVNNFVVEVSDGSLSAQATMTITVGDGSTPTVISSSDFESGLGDWTNPTGDDNYDWTRDSGGTPSSNTGPTSGAGGSNYYLFLETSDGGRGAFNAGETAYLESIELSGSNRTLSFDYHFYGSEVGTLSVDVFVNGNWVTDVWSLSGEQHSGGSVAYTGVSVDLSSYAGNIKVRFRATAAGGWHGDMAIDNLVVMGVN